VVAMEGSKSSQSLDQLLPVSALSNSSSQFEWPIFVLKTCK